MYEDSQYIEKVSKKVRMAGLIYSFISGAIAIALTVFGVIMLRTDPESAGYILVLALIAYVVLGVVGLFRVFAPLKFIGKAKNANVHKYAPSMDRKIIYQDKHMVVSEQAIANAKKPEEIVGREDVLAAWVHTQSYNFIPTSKTLNLYTPENVIVRFNVYGMRKEKINELFKTIATYCPNCRFGYSPDNYKFVAFSQKQYREANKKS